jgi:hypothetical protein
MVPVAVMLHPQKQPNGKMGRTAHQLRVRAEALSKLGLTLEEASEAEKKLKLSNAEGRLLEIAWAMGGPSAKDIADKLWVSEDTVRHQWESIYDKLSKPGEERLGKTGAVLVFSEVARQVQAERRAKYGGTGENSSDVGHTSDDKLESEGASSNESEEGREEGPEHRRVVWHSWKSWWVRWVGARVAVLALIIAGSVLWYGPEPEVAPTGTQSDIQAGDRVRTTHYVATLTASGLNVRDGPAGALEGMSVPPGVYADVLEEPVWAELNGIVYLWVKLRWPGGRVGWSALGFPGGVPYLEKG